MSEWKRLSEIRPTEKDANIDNLILYLDEYGTIISEHPAFPEENNFFWWMPAPEPPCSNLATIAKDVVEHWVNYETKNPKDVRFCVLMEKLKVLANGELKK